MDAAGTLWSSGWELWLSAACNAAVLAAIVFAVLACCGRWIAPRVRHVLWLIVAVRLALPVAPPSPFSLQNLWRAPATPRTVDALQAFAGTATSNDPLPEPDPAKWRVGIPDPSRVPAPTTPMERLDEAVAVVALVWPIGMLLTTVLLTLSAVRFRRRLRGLSACDDARLIGLFDDCRLEMGLSRRVSLLVVPGLNSPALLGLWRPKVLLPDDVASTFTADELRHVFLHELAHVQRRDVAVSWLLAAQRVVHWCNPVFWFVQSRIMAERESACDAAVLRRLPDAAPRRYGETLLRIVERSCAAPGRPATVPGFVFFLGSKPSLRRRLRAIPHLRRGEGRVLVVAGLVLTGLLAVAGWTDASAPPQETHSANSAFQVPAGVTWTFGSPPRSPWSQPEDRTYVMDDLVQREMDKSSAAREGVQRMFVDSLQHCVGLPAETRSRFGPVTNRGNDRDAVEFTWLPANAQTADGLLVRATAEEHQQLRSLIEIWRTHGLVQTVLEVRFITTTDPGLNTMGSGGRVISATVGYPSTDRSREGAFDLSAHGGTLSGDMDVQLSRRVPLFLQTLDSRSTRQLVERAQAGEGTNILFAPKVTTWNGQRGVVVSQVQRPFVTGLELTEDAVTKPQIEVIAEGESLELLAISDPEGDTVHLKCRIVRSRITDVETAGVATGTNGKTISVQIPSVEEQRFSATADLKTGETLLMSPLCRDKQGRQLYVLVTPTIINE